MALSLLSSPASGHIRKFFSHCIRTKLILAQFIRIANSIFNIICVFCKYISVDFSQIKTSFLFHIFERNIWIIGHQLPFYVLTLRKSDQLSDISNIITRSRGLLPSTKSLQSISSTKSSSETVIRYDIYSSLG